MGIFSKQSRPKSWKTFVNVDGQGHYVTQTPNEILNLVRDARESRAPFILLEYGAGQGPVIVSSEISSIEPKAGVGFSTLDRSLVAYGRR